MAITNLTFLRAKHWQLFFFAAILPVMIRVGLIIYYLSQRNQDIAASTDTMILVIHGFVWACILHLLVLFGWLWSVAIGIDVQIPNGGTMNKSVFKLVYWFCVALMSVILFSMGLNESKQAQTVFSFGIPSYIMPIVGCFVMGLLYLIYFVAKSIRVVELRRKVTFADFTAEFFLIWFFLIGIWFIQPRVNRFVK